MERSETDNDTTGYGIYLSKSLSSIVYLDCTCEQEILRQIDELNNTESPGPDGIGLNTLKDVAYIIDRPLAYLCNLSSQTGVFWEDSNWLELYQSNKKGDGALLTNYRPASQPSVFRKILEKLACCR
jgi:hypothetical protein